MRNLCGTPDVFPFQAFYPLSRQENLDRDISRWPDMGLMAALMKLQTGIGPASYETIPFNFSTIRRKIRIKQTSGDPEERQEALETGMATLGTELAEEEDKLMLPGMAGVMRKLQEEKDSGADASCRFLFCLASTPPFVRVNGEMVEANYRIGGLLFYEDSDTVLEIFPLVPIKQEGPVVGDDTKLKIRTFRKSALNTLLNYATK